MLLTGHEGDIFTCKFSPDGQMVASSGFDRLISLIYDVHIHTRNTGLLELDTGSSRLLPLITDLAVYGFNVSAVHSISVKVKACRDTAFYVTNTKRIPDATMVMSFYLGGGENKWTKIRFWEKGVDETYDYEFTDFLSCTDYVVVWFSWLEGDIYIGLGSVIKENILVTGIPPKTFTAAGAGVSTGYGYDGDWIIPVEYTVHEVSSGLGFFTTCTDNKSMAILGDVQNHKVSVLVCAAMCRKMKNCIGFNYRVLSTECEIVVESDDTPIELSFMTDNSWKFYTKCYQDKNVCVGCYL